MESGPNISKQISKYILTLTAIIIYLPILLNSQSLNFKFDHLSTKDGLSHNSVSDILQDNHGFIWMGTVDGLNRYDGKTFKIYKHNPTDSQSISSNFIRTLHVDNEGNLWIGTYDSGLNIFNPLTEKFTRFRHDPINANSLGNNTCGWIVNDEQGYYWIGTNSGLDKLDFQKKTFSHYQHHDDDSTSLSNNIVTFVFKDKQGTIWIGTEDGLNKLNRESGTFIRYKHNPDDPNSISANHIWSIYEDGDGILWIGTFGGGLNKFVSSTKKFTCYKHDPTNPYSINHNVVDKVFEDKSGLLWIATDGGGLNILDRKNERFYKFVNDPIDDRSLSHDNATVCCEDDGENLWIATWGGGINKISKRKQKFIHEKNLCNTFVFSIIEDDSRNLYIGTLGGGICRFDHKTNQITHLQSRINSLSDNNVWSLVFSNDHTLWIGTQAGGVDEYNLKTNKWKNYNISNSQISDNNVRSLFYSKKDNVLWIGTFNHGLNKYQTSLDRWTSYRHKPNDSTSLSQGAIWCILEDKSGNLWIGTSSGGLNRFDPTSETFSRYQTNLSNTASISNNDVRSILEDRNGVIWMGTFGGGINKFDNGKFIQYTESEGLANNFVYGILEDEEGYLWISTNRGLSKFDPTTRIFSNYTTDDGLQSEEFNTGACFKSPTGELYFGGVNGYNKFSPENVQDNTHIPKIVLTSFNVLGQPLKSDTSITDLKQIELSYAENFFSFEFAVLDFVEPTRNQYAYKLEGLDASWNYCGNRNYGSYTKVEPGKYILKIKGSNNDGIWNEEGYSIIITIIPPFYKMLWFQIIAASMLVGSFGGIVRFISLRKIRKQLNQLEKETLIQQERERVRTKIARDLHDDVSSTVSSISFYAESLKRQPPQTLQRDLLEKIGNLSTEALDTMGDIVWSIAPQHDTLNSLLNRIKNLTVDICTSNRIDYKIDIHEVANDINLYAELRQNIYLIFKESMNNIIKHANAGTVYISAGTSSNIFEMIIQDDGKGFKTETDAENNRLGGHGLNNMKNRANEINGKLRIFSQLNTGTKIHLSVRIT